MRNELGRVLITNNTRFGKCNHIKGSWCDHTRPNRIFLTRNLTRVVTPILGKIIGFTPSSSLDLVLHYGVTFHWFIPYR